MAKLTLKYKRLSPNESVSLLIDKTRGKRRTWRHRYMIKLTTVARQTFKDYPHNKFESFNEFKAFIEDKPKYKGQIL